MINNQTYLSTQNQRESNARSYPRRIPIAIEKAEGIYVTTTSVLFIHWTSQHQ